MTPSPIDRQQPPPFPRLSVLFSFFLFFLMQICASRMFTLKTFVYTPPPPSVKFLEIALILNRVWANCLIAMGGLSI